MLFKPEFVDKILQGRKTATRRIWKRPHAKINGIYKAKTIMLSKKYFAKIYVKDIYQQKIGEMQEKDALAEGFNSLNDFKKIWIDINGNWNPEIEVTVIEFRVLTEEEIALQIENILSKSLKQKFKCDTCGEILNGQQGVKDHKKKNFTHFSYNMVGSKLNLHFA